MELCVTMESVELIGNTTNLFNWSHTIKSWDNYVLVSYNTSVIPISQTLNFSKLPITQTKSGFPSLTKSLHSPLPLLFSQTPWFSLTSEVQEIWILLNVSYWSLLGTDRSGQLTHSFKQDVAMYMYLTPTFQHALIRVHIPKSRHHLIVCWLLFRHNISTAWDRWHRNGCWPASWYVTPRSVAWWCKQAHR